MLLIKPNSKCTETKTIFSYNYLVHVNINPFFRTKIHFLFGKWNSELRHQVKLHINLISIGKACQIEMDSWHSNHPNSSYLLTPIKY